MSRHSVNTQIDNKSVQLVMGWDRPLKQFFFNVHDLTVGPQDDDILATSMDMKTAELNDLDAILEQLKELGLTPPPKMVEEVRADKVNNVGNRMETYN